MSYDLKITGGTIIDGTGKPGFVGDLGIKDGRVVTMGKAEGPATATIDAKGKVARVWRSVKVDGHDTAVLAALQELTGA